LNFSVINSPKFGRPTLDVYHQVDIRVFILLQNTSYSLMLVLSDSFLKIR